MIWKLDSYERRVSLIAFCIGSMCASVFGQTQAMDIDLHVTGRITFPVPTTTPVGQPTPTPAPTPGPTPTATPASTPPGVLTQLEITTPGAIYDGITVIGRRVMVRAANVTIRNSTITLTVAEGDPDYPECCIDVRPGSAGVQILNCRIESKLPKASGVFWPILNLVGSNNHVNDNIILGGWDGVTGPGGYNDPPTSVGNEICRNVIVNSMDDGIEIDGIPNCLVEGNVISGCTNGISMAPARGAIIRGNSIDRYTQMPFKFNFQEVRGTDALLEDNFFRSDPTGRGWAMWQFQNPIYATIIARRNVGAYGWATPTGTGSQGSCFVQHVGPNGKATGDFYIDYTGAGNQWWTPKPALNGEARFEYWIPASQSAVGQIPARLAYFDYLADAQKAGVEAGSVFANPQFTLAPVRGLPVELVGQLVVGNDQRPKQ